MKSAILLVATFAVVSVTASTKGGYGPVFNALPAPVIAAPVAPVVALASTGSSTQFRSQDSNGNSNFGYDESHATGATSRREETVNGVVRGSYSLSDVDGRRRVVSYIADNDGFRANVQTNEPGVEPKDPADVLINKAPVVVAAPAPVAIAAPAPLVRALPAPIQFAAPAPLPIAAPAPLPAPVFGAIKGFNRLAPVAAPLPAPLPAPVAFQAPIAIEEPSTPLAFSYNIGVSHLAPRPVAVAAAPAWAPAPAIVEQQQIVQQQQTIDY